MDVITKTFTTHRENSEIVDGVRVAVLLEPARRNVRVPSVLLDTVCPKAEMVIVNIFGPGIISVVGLVGVDRVRHRESVQLIAGIAINVLGRRHPACFDRWVPRPVLPFPVSAEREVMDLVLGVGDVEVGIELVDRLETGLPVRDHLFVVAVVVEPVRLYVRMPWVLFAPSRAERVQVGDVAPLQVIELIDRVKMADLVARLVRGRWYVGRVVSTFDSDVKPRHPGRWRRGVVLLLLDRVRAGRDRDPDREQVRRRRR